MASLDNTNDQVSDEEPETEAPAPVIAPVSHVVPPATATRPQPVPQIPPTEITPVPEPPETSETKVGYHCSQSLFFSGCCEANILGFRFLVDSRLSPLPSPLCLPREPPWSNPLLPSHRTISLSLGLSLPRQTSVSACALLSCLRYTVLLSLLCYTLVNGDPCLDLVTCSRYTRYCPRATCQGCCCQ